MSALHGYQHSPHVRYRADVRPEDKNTAKTRNIAYSNTTYAAQDPSSPNPRHTPTRAQQALPRRSSLCSSANGRVPASAQSQQPAPFRNVYLENLRRAQAVRPDLFPPSRWPQPPAGPFAPNVDSVSLPPSTPQAASPQAAQQEYNAAAPLRASPESRSPPAILQDLSTACHCPCCPYATTDLPNAQGSAHYPPLAGGTENGTFHSPSVFVRPTADLPLPSAPGNLAAATATDVDSHRQEGHVVVSEPVSFEHTDGIYALAKLSSWEDARSLDVTQPINLNDLRTILQRAANLEDACFAFIVPLFQEGP